MNNILERRFKNKKQAALSLLIMWVICFFVSAVVASYRYDMPFVSIFTEYLSDLLPMIVTLSVGLSEFIWIIIPPLEYEGEVIIYFTLIIVLVFTQIAVIIKRSIALYILLFALLLFLSYSWVYTALRLSWV